MTTPQTETASVVVSLDPGERRDFVLELARCALPSQLRELLGLYVENQTLLDHARSRQAREVLRSGSQRALSHAAIERQIRAEAERARAQFEAAGMRLGMQCRFETIRGDVLLEPIRRAAGAQALVFSIAQGQELGVAHRGFFRRLFEAGLPLVLLARPGWLSGKSIAVVIRDAEDAPLEAGARIALQTRSPLVVLLSADDEGERQQTAGKVAENLRRRGIEKFELIAVNPASIEVIARTTRSYNARLLIMHAPAAIEDDGPAQLMRRFSGALMFVSA